MYESVSVSVSVVEGVSECNSGYVRHNFINKQTKPE